MSKKIVLKSGASLGAFLDSVIEETVKSTLHQKALQEKEKQSQASQGGDENSSDDGGDNTDLFGGDDSGDGSGLDDEGKSSKTFDDETEKLSTGEVQSSDVIEKLNAIRAGRSFKDEKVGSAMEEYVESLTKAEKVALLAFLKGIAQIVTGEVPGKQAVDPEDDPADVSMKKSQHKEKQKSKHIEPNVIKTSLPKEKPKKGSEDTSGPVPIIAKKK